MLGILSNIKMQKFSKNLNNTGSEQLPVLFECKI